MEVSGKLSRLIRVISIISNIGKTKEEIIQILEKEFEISNRTFDRIIQDIRDFGFEVEYKKDIGYRIVGIEDFDEEYMRILTLNKIISSRALLNISSDKKLDQYFLQDKFNDGSIHIASIMGALTNKQKLEIIYHRFTDANSFKREVIPLKLMESDYRWYLITCVLPEFSIRTYALDRIEKISLGNNFSDSDVPKESLKIAGNYYSKIGVRPELFTEEPGKLYEISLAVTQPLLPYLITRPIHPSQIITGQIIDDKVIVKLTIIPTDDLIKLVAKELGDIQITGPEKLTDFIKTKFTDLAKVIIS